MKAVTCENNQNNDHRPHAKRRHAHPSKIVGHHISIEEVPGAYEKFDKPIDGYTKVLIHFDSTKAGAVSA
jgi:threonine dehydrogenase-like Zn-dependent dehydrogenase